MPKTKQHLKERLDDIQHALDNMDLYNMNQSTEVLYYVGAQCDAIEQILTHLKSWVETNVE